MSAIVNFRLAVLRHLEKGDLDPTFSIGGQVITDFTSSTGEGITALAIDSNGRIVVGGVAAEGSSAVFALACYTSHGSLDHTFGIGGKRVTNLTGSANEEINALAIDSNDRIVVGGGARQSGILAGVFALARYTSQGSLDHTFGTAGVVLTDFTSSAEEQIKALAIDSNGRIVVGGWVSDGVFALACYTPQGVLDHTFGIGGKRVTNFIGSSIEQINALAIDSNDRIVVGGRADQGSGSVFAVARYTSDGALDHSFGTAGVVLTDFTSSPEEQINALAIDSNGRIVVGGREGIDGVFALACYTPQGVLDPTFGSGGKRVTNFIGSSIEQINALAIDSNDRIVVGGRADQGSGSVFAVARYTSDGALDHSFSNDGVATTHFFSGSARVGVEAEGTAIAIDVKDRIVAGGWVADVVIA